MKSFTGHFARAAPHNSYLPYMTDHLNIYIIENEDPERNSSGGVMSYIINLGKFLNSAGIIPFFFIAGKAPAGKPGTGSFNYQPVAVANKRISNVLYLLLLFVKVFRVPNSPDSIIHSQRSDFLLPFILFRPKARFVVTMHGMRDVGFTFKKGKMLGRIYAAITRFCLRRTHQVIFVDKNSLAFYRKLYPWIAGKETVIPIGVDVTVFKPADKSLLRKKYGFSDRDRIALFVGRLEKEKNVDFFLRVCNAASKEIPSLKVVIAGTGSCLFALVELQHELNFNEVTFLGEIENKLVPEIINLADVLALCSEYEGSPTVIKEALACGVPVISNDVGDAREVLKDIPGCIIAEKETDPYSKGIVRILSSNPAKYLYKYALPFSYDIVYAKVITVYLKARQIKEAR